MSIIKFILALLLVCLPVQSKPTPYPLVYKLYVTLNGYNVLGEHVSQRVYYVMTFDTYPEKHLFFGADAQLGMVNIYVAILPTGPWELLEYFNYNPDPSLTYQAYVSMRTERKLIRQ